MEMNQYGLEKIENKVSGFDELFSSVRSLDQFTKITETKVLNEVNNMNANIELIREKMRVERSETKMQ